MTEFKQRIINIPQEYQPRIEELPGELSRIAAVIERYYPGLGVPVTLLLAQTYPGQPLYIHNVKALERKVRDDAIRAKYDQGVKLKDLATETGLCTRQVERVLAKASQEQLEEQQMRLW